MVLVDGVKYACQTCIKGHRSSKCTHTDRELTEIKKKGRPTSQCNHCRELRKSKSVHGKCECIGSKEAREQTPIAKVLPNGLVDIMKPNQASSSSNPEPRKSRVSLLLSSCNCRSGGSCNCCQTVPRAKPKAFPDTPSSPLFAPSELPVPPPPTSEPIQSGCCSSTRPPPRAQSPRPEIQPSISSCCSSRRETNSPSLAPPSDIQVSSFPSPPAYTPAPINPLFLPQTHGTLSCFCGPTCQCVGCATHDPFALKAKRKRSNSSGEETIGCKCEVSPGESEAESVRKGKKKKECCSSSSKDSHQRTRSRSRHQEEHDLEMAWPELSLASGANSEPGGGGGNDSITNPLPSLRTLFPALIDSTTLQQYSSSTTSSIHSGRDPYPDPLVPPSYTAASEPMPDEEPKIACSSAFVNEIFDGDGECGDRCLCDAVCGCRKDSEDSLYNTEQQGGEVEEMGEIARLAEMGHFG
ncbi:hypothetical protein JCM16303_007408 [Sporobolomyces ruberrimus]